MKNGLVNGKVIAKAGGVSYPPALWCALQASRGWHNQGHFKPSPGQRNPINTYRVSSMPHGGLSTFL